MACSIKEFLSLGGFVTTPTTSKQPPEHTIAFWSDQMCERGTEVALYDYADAAERCLGVSAFVLYDEGAHNNYEGAIDKFRRRFGRCRVEGDKLTTTPL